jgi:hypothetical protein
MVIFKICVQYPELMYLLGVYQSQRVKLLDPLGRDLLCCRMQFLQGTHHWKRKFNYSREFSCIFVLYIGCACGIHFRIVDFSDLCCVGRLGGKVKLSWKLLSISKLDNGGYTLTYETPQGLVSLQSKSVVMTVPSHIASGLLHPISVCLLLV